MTPPILFALFGEERVALRGNILVDYERYSVYNRTDLFRQPLPLGASPISPFGVDQSGKAAIGSRKLVELEGRILVEGPVIVAGEVATNFKKTRSKEKAVFERSYSNRLPKRQQLLDYFPTPALQTPITAVQLETSANFELPGGEFLCPNLLNIVNVTAKTNVFLSDDDDSQSIQVGTTRFFHPPADLKLWYSGTKTIRVCRTKGSIFWGLIYAPQSTVRIESDSEISLCGAVVAREIVITGNHRITFDLELISPMRN